MKSLACNISALTFLFAAGRSSAEVIYSGLQDTPIALTYAGIQIDVDTDGIWDLNPYLGGAYLANNTGFQPARDGTGGMDTVNQYVAGNLISGGLLYATGMGGSIDHLGSTFTDGQEGYLGFKLGSNHGWMRVVFTSNTGLPVVPLIKDWAYDTSGGSISAGNVIQSGSIFTLDSSTQNFTLGSAIAGSNAVVKTGDNTVTLAANNNYTGTTDVTVGKLVVNGSISTSILTTVSSGATIGGSGTVGALTIESGGFVTPGNSPGILNTGNYTQAGTYAAEIAGITAGVGGYDQINVSGTVNLTGGSLTTAFDTFTPENGNLLFILLNDDAEAITGTFTGFAQGDVVATYGGFDWLISYAANSGGTPSFTGGNDIALMAVPEPSAAMLAGGLGMLALLRRRR